jgi:hypothetical protein
MWVFDGDMRGGSWPLVAGLNHGLCRENIRRNGLTLQVEQAGLGRIGFEEREQRQIVVIL